MYYFKILALLVISILEELIFSLPSRMFQLSFQHVGTYVFSM
jgi:hypothetical protein